MRANDESELSRLAERAQGGDRDALEQLVRLIQDRVHHLAVRMLFNPEDALEATQEILILVVTKLSTFRGESAFSTWVYRVAANYLLTARKLLAKDPELDFEAYRADLEDGLVSEERAAPFDEVLLNELRVACTTAMLLCLDRRHRLAYILGDVLELDHREASEILEISAANFRKRLSRARAEVLAFTAATCGVTNPSAACSCPRRLPAAIAAGRVVPGRSVFASSSTPGYHEVVRQAQSLEQELATLKAQRATGAFDCPTDLGARIAQAVDLHSVGE